MYIDGLARRLADAVPGVHLACHSSAPSSTGCLLYADDLVLIAESVADMQLALDIVTRWARTWRLSFGHGPEKSAIMSFFGGPAEGLSPCRLEGEPLPYVRS